MDMIGDVAALLLFLFPLAYSPGPGNLFFSAVGARSGWRGAIPALAGYHLATWIVTLAVGVGLFQVLLGSPPVFTALSWAGSAYMIWMAWGFVRAGRLSGHASTGTSGFLDGVVLLVLNGKAYVIIAMMFSQFLNAVEGGHLARLTLITTVFTLNNLVAFVVWTLMGQGLARVFSSPAAARALNLGFALTLAGTAIWMLPD